MLAAVNTEYTWSNVPYANVWGLEFEGRKQLGNVTPALDNFSLSGNVTLIKSEARIWDEELAMIRATDPNHPDTRPLFGQSPYIVNAMLNYQGDSAKFNAAVAFNVQGDKLFLVTEGGAPDIYQRPTPAARRQFFAALWRELLRPLPRTQLAEPCQPNDLHLPRRRLQLVGQHARPDVLPELVLHALKTPIRNATFEKSLLELEGLFF